MNIWNFSDTKIIKIQYNKLNINLVKIKNEKNNMSLKSLEKILQASGMQKFWTCSLDSNSFTYLATILAIKRE